MKRNILISGGGIAGLTAAKLLSSQGHDVTVIDKAPSFTKAGFLISLKSFGVKIMDELGMTENLLHESSPSEYAAFMEANERVIQKISYEEMNKNTERSVLISRGGLHHVLFENIKDEVKVLLNTTISQAVQQGDTTRVTLSDGTAVTADLVIIAEGLRSPTREQYFKNCKLEDFNTIYMGGKLKFLHGYTVGSFKIYIDVNKMLSIYPIAPDEIALQCYIQEAGTSSTGRPNANELLANSFKGYSEGVQDLLKRFIAEGLMFVDKMGMINAPDLVNGHLVLLGDAGYCPTALSGMGASLSIYGAKAPAHFISKTPENLTLACKNYNTLMQPLIQKFQGNARKNAASFIPKSEERLHQFVHAFRSASDDDLQKIMTDPIILTEEQLSFKIG
ncbi:FAD-dependent monooxygenase [Chitinophaga sedimenti]|uniref:FAD-dependent monooxygenase n=1 Tax=Chitinophaga sedimenti TaxID=2033606 RepID=UPI002002D864|nr:FAD-dependent monooxygenase [Chitinophaga sedimenti]MCK7555594.1 FAD-dependent monooxygenase [Chitinophaga sedimenti]